jgi:hypothetical protein
VPRTVLLDGRQVVVERIEVAAAVVGNKARRRGEERFVELLD